ncbi:flagellar biosynthesis protein FlhB [Sphingosinicella sp. BN140058]|uniref:flagellar biosynthesis protein FlhB n=1 Tax=Sphingosinicella sp. BN140058 TaxID=1892855 RepID=UPI001010AA76|nr:flagellar biosynthesis protein FlhB [Sphingosinicella sp. BN140058]QAY76624.1 flagellar biosynthesis protein FlhB [Sphingosinicella sp. BN140058]
MSDAPDQDQKTHDPTGKKLDEAREKGDVPMASEMRHAAMFIGAVVMLGGLGAVSLHALSKICVRIWGGADTLRLEPEGAQGLFTGLSMQVVSALTPVFAFLIGMAVLGGLLQGRPTIAWARVGFKWSKLNPMAGFGRIFGKQAFVEFLKSLTKIIVVVGIAFMVVWPKAAALDQLIGSGPERIGSTTLELCFSLVKTIAILVVVIAMADFIYQKRAFMKRMRMTLQEVKDEFKQSEGDPKIKGKIRQIAMQRSRRRMMAAVPTASVIVTNPTHYAVALKYEHGDMAAPIVVAKGLDAIALKIRAIATEAGVPIVENRPLARALYASVEIDRPIPAEHYAAVAEIISFVMRLAKRRRT